MHVVLPMSKKKTSLPAMAAFPSCDVRRAAGQVSWEIS